MLYDNFQKLLKERNLRPADITRKTGIGSNFLSEWKKGNSVPKIDKLYAIACALDVSLDELYTGKKQDLYLTQEEKDLLSLFRGLSADGKSQLILQAKMVEATFTQKTNKFERMAAEA